MHLRHSTRTLSAIPLILILSIAAQGQSPVRMTSAEIHQGIKKLRVLGTALYVAAHPDDENTRLISYFSKERKVHTTYLSMTRGDGGQNLVGPEIRELLGVIRTQELMMARRLDGGHQLFTRANDFGYSKTPEETLDFWNKEEVLADVVWAIRKLQPDIIVNRFPHEHLNGNHGHHTASALLSYEAFGLAADPTAFPEQLKYVDTWQPKRMFFNTHWWFYGSREAFEEADKGDIVEVDVGVYYPMMGISNPEIAAKSRSMHKSQGFGAAGERGSVTEHLELIRGEMPEREGDLFAGIDITWDRVQGGARIDAMIRKIDAQFDHEKPYLSVPGLLLVSDAISALPPSIWKERKTEEVKDLIRYCMGLYIEAVADTYWATPGDSVMISLEAANRSPVDLELVSASLDGNTLSHTRTSCVPYTPFVLHQRIALPERLQYSSPYWLREPWSEGMYTVEDQSLRGLPENVNEIAVNWTFDVAGHEISYETPVVFKRTDPVQGEVYRPFDIVPRAFVNIGESVYMFAGDTPQPVEVRVKSTTDSVAGVLRLECAKGWQIDPPMHDVELTGKGDERVFTFTLTPPRTQTVSDITAGFHSAHSVTDKSLIEIQYDHIPTQVVLLPAVSRVVKVDLKRAGSRVGYISGAGDDVPRSLEHVGYIVDVLDETTTTLEDLKRYDAVVLGIRAYNTLDRISYLQPALFAYVREGGTLVTQYNTSRGLKTDDLAPYPLSISRDRVTDETADVVILEPDHPVLHFPNEISGEDFDGWVQERGLYFPDAWDDAFEPILSMHDPGEEPTEGSLLIARYGKGYFVYTGISWFRQLPAGVPGAFRLFTNILSLGNPDRS